MPSSSDDKSATQAATQTPSQSPDQSASGTPTLPCPRCGQPARWAADNASRPFCSERCKLIDLGAWASESHRIPGDSLPPAPDDE